MESALSIKGQATIPKAIRDHLRLAPGDRVKFFVHPDGSVVILPKIPTSALKGMLHRPGRRAVSLGDTEASIADGASDSSRQGKRR
jgi:antitoxin PrlF